MPKPLRDKLAEKGKQRGFDELRDAVLKNIREILSSVKKKFVVNIEITCKIAGVGAIATYEYRDDSIPESEVEQDESQDKLEKVLGKLIEKARDRIIKALESRSLVNFEFSAGTDSIPYISWITDLEFKVTISMD